MVFQRANIELTAGAIILRVTKKNITRRLHHLLAFHDTTALVPVISDPPTEPLQYRSLGLLKLKEKRLAIASHQQRNTAECPHRADANRLKDKIYYFMRSEEHTSELQSLRHLVCRLLLEKKKQTKKKKIN